MFPKKVDGGFYFQDIGNHILPFDVLQALIDLGNIYYGSSRSWEQVVRFENYYDGTVVLDLDECYYTGVFNPLIYQYYSGYNDRAISRTPVYGKNGFIDFVFFTFFPSLLRLKHISEASCCFRAFVSLEDHTLYQSTLIRKETIYGTMGKFSPCLKSVKPKQLIFDYVKGFYYA